ncbi:bifunctional nuclease family protein, partial [Candidatus Woesearchaeota archaeon]|nr:bifunctional nuclease family protein [Candidatus Woesearchaeota archaeon]
AIQLGLLGQVVDRPTVYDSWAGMIDTFGIRFDAMTMYGVDDDVSAYLSHGYFQFNSEVTELDMKPSDAIALALRTKTPIYINTTLLKEKGENICAGGNESGRS